MVPGFKANSELAKYQASSAAEANLGVSPKKSIDDVVKNNTNKFIQYGAAHLGDGVARLEPKMFRGGGGLLNLANPQS